MIQSVCEFCDK